MRNRVRVGGLAALLLLAVPPLCAQAVPERATSAGFPVTPYDQVKPRLLEAATLNGDLDRMVAHVQAFRGIVESVVQQANPEALPKLAPVLDEYFGKPAVTARVSARFGGSGLGPDHPAEILAWAKSPDMVAVNAAIRDFDFSRESGQISPDRHALMGRIANAMVLPSFAVSQTWDAQEIAAKTMDAIDPDAGAMESLDEQQSSVQRPTSDMVVEKWLAPALERQSDAALSKFLVFAEGEAGRRYFASFFVTGSVEANPVYKELPPLVTANAARAPSAVADPQALVDEAERLMFQVGTRSAYSEARQLLLQAERAAPRDARIKALAGEHALLARDGSYTDPGQVRPDKPLAQHFEPAERYLRAALELDPDNAEALYAMGYSAFLQHDNAKAREYLDRAAKVWPDHPLGSLGLRRSGTRGRTGRRGDHRLPRCARQARRARVSVFLRAAARARRL